jgi:hypothetical protein
VAQLFRRVSPQNIQVFAHSFECVVCGIVGRSLFVLNQAKLLMPHIFRFSNAWLRCFGTLVLLASLAGLSGCSDPKPAFKGVDITGADYAKELSLPDQNGQVRKLKDFSGKLVVVFFGYTQCPDVCPTTMQELAEVKRLLGPDGDKLQAVGRTRQGKVFQITSDDAGKTWGEISLTDLPNPNSGTDAVTLADGRQLLVYNHSGHRAAEAKGNRYPLDVAVSLDGLTWKRVLTLETEPCAAGYSYPAVIQSADGRIHITYTWNRKLIKHVEIDPARL